MIVFYDEYKEECSFLGETLQYLDLQHDIVFMKDTAMLPEGMFSIYEYIIRRKEKNTYCKKLLDFPFAVTPEWWNVKVEGVEGKIYHLGKVKAVIIQKNVREARSIGRVEWLADTGVVCKIDYYNQYGFIGSRGWCDETGKEILRSYYTSAGEEILSYDLQKDIVVLYEAGSVKQFFASKAEFEKYVYRELMAAGERIILTSLRQIELLYEADAEKKAKVFALLSRSQEIQKYREWKIQDKYPLMIVNNADTTLSHVGIRQDEIRICYCKECSKAVNANGDILILTNSDNIEELVTLIDALPDKVFHIAALTRMSDKLLALNAYSNVKTYQGIKKDKLQDLLEKSSFYFDINYGREICDAVMLAGMNHMLIFSFTDTCHNIPYILPECVVEKGNWKEIVDVMYTVIEDESMWKKLLERQRQQHEKSLKDMVLTLTCGGA